MQKSVFITGGCGLLGSAVASEFHHEGYRVIVLDTESVLSKVVFDLPHESHSFDVTDTAEQKTSLNELEKIYGPIQNWINCAYPRTSNYLKNTLESLDPSDWHSNTQHLDSICLLSSQVAALMAVNGGGSIVNVASIYGMVSPRFSIYPEKHSESPPVYSAVKAGISIIHVILLVIMRRME